MIYRTFTLKTAMDHVNFNSTCFLYNTMAIFHALHFSYFVLWQIHCIYHGKFIERTMDFFYIAWHIYINITYRWIFLLVTWHFLSLFFIFIHVYAILNMATNCYIQLDLIMIGKLIFCFIISMFMHFLFFVTIVF